MSKEHFFLSHLGDFIGRAFYICKGTSRVVNRKIGWKAYWHKVKKSWNAFWKILPFLVKALILRVISADFRFQANATCETMASGTHRLTEDYSTHSLKTQKKIVEKKNKDHFFFLMWTLTTFIDVLTKYRHSSFYNILDFLRLFL